MKKKSSVKGSPPRKKKSIPKRVIGGVVAATAVVSMIWLYTGHGKKVQVPAYSVESVADGDTFMTAEKQIVRLSAIDSPEKGRCGSIEAQTTLAQLVLDKPVYLKILYHDSYSRFSSLVYTDEGLINEKMLRSGWALLNDRDGVGMKELKEATDEAQEKKLGLFSEKCTQMVNKDHPKCNIKGNTNTNSNEDFYHMPGCTHYDQVEVQLYEGDQWFCTEAEAQKAGFKKAETCI